MKQELHNLSNLVEKIGKLWNDTMLTTASVLLQNMAVACDSEHNRSFFDSYIEIFEDFKKVRPNSHVFDWINSEVYMIVEGNYMSEEWLKETLEENYYTDIEDEDI